MYNEEIKLRFISERNDEITTSSNYLNCLFEKASEIEEKLNKDLCNFTFYDITEFYKLLNISSVLSLTVMNSHYSLYTQWCMQQNLVRDGQNHYLEMRTEDYVNCINKGKLDMQILPKEVIYNWVDQLNNPKDQFILLGLFEGIRGKDFCELANLRPEDIKGNTAHLCTGREVNISNKLLNIIEDCIETKTYTSMTGKEVKIMPLVDDGYIIKGYPNTKSSAFGMRGGRIIKNSVQRIAQYFGVFPVVSANNIVESGKINTIKEYAKEKGMNCIDYIYSSYINEIEDKYNCTIVKKSYILKYRDYLL